MNLTIIITRRLMHKGMLIHDLKKTIVAITKQKIRKIPKFQKKWLTMYLWLRLENEAIEMNCSFFCGIKFGLIVFGLGLVIMIDRGPLDS